MSTDVWARTNSMHDFCIQIFVSSPINVKLNKSSSSILINWAINIMSNATNDTERDVRCGDACRRWLRPRPARCYLSFSQWLSHPRIAMNVQDCHNRSNGEAAWRTVANAGNYLSSFIMRNALAHNIDNQYRFNNLQSPGFHAALNYKTKA